MGNVRNWRKVPPANSQVKATFMEAHRRSGWSDLSVVHAAGLSPSAIHYWLSNADRHVQLETAAALLAVYGYEIIAVKKGTFNGK